MQSMRSWLTSTLSISTQSSSIHLFRIQSARKFSLRAAPPLKPGGRSAALQLPIYQASQFSLRARLQNHEKPLNHRNFLDQSPNFPANNISCRPNLRLFNRQSHVCITLFSKTWDFRLSAAECVLATTYCQQKVQVSLHSTNHYMF